MSPPPPSLPQPPDPIADLIDRPPRDDAPAPAGLRPAVLARIAGETPPWRAAAAIAEAAAEDRVVVGAGRDTPATVGWGLAAALVLGVGLVVAIDAVAGGGAAGGGATWTGVGDSLGRSLGEGWSGGWGLGELLAGGWTALVGAGPGQGWEILTVLVLLAGLAALISRAGAGAGAGASRRLAPGLGSPRVQP